ncbi:unnamed protein product [Bubo scandiacus]
MVSGKVDEMALAGSRRKIRCRLAWRNKKDLQCTQLNHSLDVAQIAHPMTVQQICGLLWSWVAIQFQTRFCHNKIASTIGMVDKNFEDDSSNINRNAVEAIAEKME